ncbi:hypothetical protein AVEN_140224-1 [Araneus ventricosus]|uniref:Uncharacterized protein n=1 Tax=Araneus ventricosus TaxID=182803 RepID=A0A4Y2I775_ARAVE|nr:hypothetical protein AVEN_140224-1 [Araneus ventricosus]
MYCQCFGETNRACGLLLFWRDQERLRTSTVLRDQESLWISTILDKQESERTTTPWRNQESLAGKPEPPLLTPVLKG